MATAKKLPSGNWNCSVYSHSELVTDKKGKPVFDENGKQKKKRIYKSFTCDIPGPKGKRKCEQIAADWAAEKEDISHGKNITLEEAIEKYIESRQALLSPRTIMDYKQICRNGLQTIMPMKIYDITQEHVQLAVNIDAQTHKPKTVRNNHGLLSAVMNVYRPEFRLKTKLPKKVRPEIYVPTDSDIKALMDTARGSEMELPILLAAFGPMRRGEISALHTRNINGNVVHVCDNMVLGTEREWIIKAPKSFAGDRYIDYPDFVADKFKDASGFITSLNPNCITSRFATILKKADLPSFRFHDLRHYSASIQHALGIPDSYIMQRGGWESDATLKTVYRHAMIDREKEMNGIANNHFSKLNGMQDEMQDKKNKPL